MKLKSLDGFNFRNKSAGEIVKASGVSYPAVKRYLIGASEKQGSVIHVARVLSGMGIDYRNITLGELIEDAPSD